MNFTHPESYVASLKRLYKAGKINDSYLKGLVKSGKLTQEEYEYIIAE